MRLSFALGLLSITACSGPAASSPHAEGSASRPESASTVETSPQSTPSAVPSSTASADAAGKDDPPFSPDGVVVPIPALGLTFTVPHPQAGELYEGARLATLRDCKGEWDREFAEVADAALPFDALIAHVGSEPMCNGVTFDDIHVRAYVVPGPVATVVAKIRRDGGAKVTALAKEPEMGRKMGEEPADPKWTPRKSFPGFGHVGLSYPRFYGDYGGVAHVDFFTKGFGDKTLVMVIMSTRSPVMFGDGKRIDPFEQIMTSVKPAGDASAKK